MPALVWGLLGGGPPVRPGHRDGRGGRKQRRKAAAPPADAGHSGDADQQQQHLQQEQQQQGEADRSSQPPSSSSSGPSARLPGAPLGLAAALGSARNWGFLLKAVSVHGADLAARLAGTVAAPLQARWQAQLEHTPAVRQACRALGVETLGDLQDLLNSIILSEHVYKIVDHPLHESLQFINATKADFPPHLVTLQSVQWAQPHVRHRFLLGESREALYVAFMGTKVPRDMVTNANLFQEEVVLDAAMLSSTASADLEGEAAAGGSRGGSSRPPAAHRGFLTRARSIPIEQLYAEARARGKRLVLCGHSLGGAVASLCAIKLLQHLPPSLHHTVSVYGFATPALGNSALAAMVAECGWDRRIHSYLNPDDPIPSLLSFRRSPSGSSAAAAAAAAGAAAEPAAAGGAAADGGSRSSSSRGEAERGARPAAMAQAAALAAAAAAVAVTGTAAADGVAANNIQAAPRLAAGAQQRVHRIASHLQADRESNRLPRSSSAPALLGDASTAADAVAAVDAAAPAPAPAPLLEQAPPAATTAAAAVAAAAANGGGAKQPRLSWLGQRLAAAAPPLRRASSAALAAAAPPVRAVVERAGSAARLVAMPLSAAASVPMRAAPQYLPLGRQLWVLPGSVADARPAGGSAGGGGDGDAAEPVAPAPAAVVAAMAAPAARRPLWAPFWRPQPAAAADDASQDEEEDNVDVAAAASLAGASAPPAVAAASVAGQASRDGGEGGEGERRRKEKRGVFDAHRMREYRARLLAICQDALEGHLMLRSLPMLPTLPRPGDVTSTELVAPPMFPLRAVATVVQPEGAMAAAAVPPLPAAAAAAAGSASVDGPAGAAAPPAAAPAAPPPPLGFWRGLLARAAAQAQQRKDEPVELMIRVDGRGLENVTKAWVEGLPPGHSPPGAAAAAAAAAAAGNGGGAPHVYGHATSGKPHAAAAGIGDVAILQQPQPKLAAAVGAGRPPLPVVGHLSAFVSWLAVTLGWVALLRQLQPAGRSDYLLARVRLPASAVHSAYCAAQPPLLQAQGGEGPTLLHGLHLGPRLSLHLQSDFAVHSVPLDIRVAAELPRHRGWQWPWRRQHAPPGQLALQQPSPQQQRGRGWWEWPAGGASAGQ